MRPRKNQTSLPLRWSLEHGSYYYRVPVGQREQWDGKTKYRLGATLAEAYASWYRRVEPEVMVTTADAFARYEKEIVPTLATPTQRDYRKALDRLRPVFAAMAPADILPRHVYAYLDRRPPVAGNRERAVLSGVMARCVRWGLVERNLVREVERYRESPRGRYVTDEELEAFRSHCGAFLKAYIELKMLTGLRQGQLLALQRNAWDGERLTAAGVKRGKAVTYRGEGLQEAITAVLDLYKGKAVRSTFLFATRLGGRYTGDGFRAIWQRAMRKFVAKGGERFTEHDLRAKVASDSASTEDASDRMGHQSMTTTKRVYRRKPVEVIVLNAATRGGKTQ